MGSKPVKTLSKEDVKKWQERIRLSETWRDPYENKWKRFLRYADGKFFDSASDGDRIVVNLVHPHVRIIIPAIYSKNPDILVQPRQQRFEESAKVMELLLRYLIKEIGLKDEIKTCLLDALIVGHSWIKVGYQTEFETAAINLPIIQKVAKRFSEMLRGETTPDDSTFYLEPDERVKSETPWALRVSPMDILVPAYSNNRFTLPWIDHRTIRRLSDIKDNKDFKNRGSLHPSRRAIDLLQSKELITVGSTVTSEVDEFDEYVVLHEIWDCTRNQIYLIPDEDSGDEYLEIKPNDYSFLDSRHCFEMIGFNFLPDKFYPLSEIEPWEPQLLELNDIRTQRHIHRKRYNRRYVYVEGDLTPSALEALKAGEDGALIPTTGEDARAVVAPVMDAALPQDVYMEEKAVKEDITNIGGITDYQRGSAAAGAKTATEASIVESQSRFRSEERLDVVGTFALRIIRNIAMIAQHFMDADHVFPIIGDKATEWKKINKKEIQGEYSYDITYGSTAAVNRDVQKQQYLQAYEMMAQDPLYNKLKIRTEFLRLVIDAKDPASWLDPEMAALLKQTEMQQMQDAMAAGPPIPGKREEGNNPSSGVGASADMMGALRRNLTTRTPGGIGGGTMNG
jgi:hypothetical protein